MKLRNLIAALFALGFVMATGTAGFAETAPFTGPAFVIAGDVGTPKTIYWKDLRTLPTAQENITYVAAGVVETQAFTGVLLWDLLNSVGGIVVDPTIKNDILRKIIVVTGSDGYEAVFTAGEIAPYFGGEQVMIVYAVNGAPVGAQGPTRIVSPGDKQGGRFVSNIVQIVVKDGG